MKIIQRLKHRLLHMRRFGLYVHWSGTVVCLMSWLYFVWQVWQGRAWFPEYRTTIIIVGSVYFVGRLLVHYLSALKFKRIFDHRPTPMHHPHYAHHQSLVDSMLQLLLWRHQHHQELIRQREAELKELMPSQANIPHTNAQLWREIAKLARELKRARRTMKRTERILKTAMTLAEVFNYKVITDAKNYAALLDKAQTLCRATAHMAQRA